jgi:steroid 5-alpha reductase family enzyme
MSTSDVLLLAAAVIGIVMVATWLVSLPLRNASIVDITWGLGFVAVAWAVRFTADGYEPRQNLLVALTTVWGLRLAGYLAWRNLGHGEDYRYQAMRKKAGPSFPLLSLFTVFALQGIIMWMVSLPVQLGQVDADGSGWPVFAVVGSAVWLVGMVFEAGGDLQLARFKADPANKGKLFDKGFWAWTRHPNYFGDFCVWWGIALVAFPQWPGPIGVVGAATISFMLMRVSGVALLERSLTKRKDGYTAYAERTPAFFPKRPSSSS